MQFLSNLFQGVPLESLILYVIALVAVFRATRAEDSVSIIDRILDLRKTSSTSANSRVRKP